MKKWIRIKAACCIALLLLTTTLSPAITAKAEREGGGHQVEGGDGGSTQRPTDNPEDDTTITTNEDGTRTLKFSQSIYFMNDDNTLSARRKYDHVITGNGKFVLVGYYSSTNPDSGFSCSSYILSDKEFTLERTETYWNGEDTSIKKQQRPLNSYKGVYYSSLDRKSVV